MRSINNLLLAAVATATVFAACRKETLDPVVRQVGGAPKDEGCDFNVSVECGMLSFTDAAHFDEILDCLDARYEANLEWLEQEYGSLDDDQFDDAVEQLGWNEDNAIIDFLAGLGFTSYWSHYETALNQFLEQGGEPWNFGMPDPFSTPTSAALRNKYGAVMIGGIIYVTMPNGNELTFCSCEAYELYTVDPSGYVLDPNDPCVGLIEKQTFTGNNGFECSDYWKMCHWNNYISNKNMKVKLIFEYSASDGTAAEARQDSWKKRSNGRWKRHYTKLRPRIDGKSGTIECVFRGSFTKERPQRRARTRTSGVKWPGQHHTFRNLEVSGTYNWAGGSYTDAITLDWTQSVCWN